MALFQHRKLNEFVTVITDSTGVHMFLVEGKTSAMLIDTGAGIGNLREYVEELTSLPYQVFLTHGHVDHAGGAPLFDEVYLHEADKDLIKRHCTMESKMKYGAMTAGVTDESSYVAWRKQEFMPISDGQKFDLGEISLEVIHVPGHTAGMCCILFPEFRTMLYGDACNNSLFLFDEEALCISDLKKGLLKLLGYSDQFDNALFSHGPEVQNKNVVNECIFLCDEILQGKDDKVPFQFLGSTGFIAKKIMKDGITREDGMLGNIVYSSEKVK